MAREPEKFALFERPGVHGFLHVPPGIAKRGMVLTHGAGSNCTAPLLLKVADALVGAGFAVLRCDLAFRQERPRGPPHPSKAAADRAGLKVAVKALGEVGPTEIYLGGHSYGGRQSTVLAAEEPGLVRGLLLLSYPLHPPGNPERLRTQHLRNLRTPAVFVHGTEDPFGTIAEMERALALIPANTILKPIEGAAHDLKAGRFDMANIIEALP